MSQFKVSICWSTSPPVSVDQIGAENLQFKNINLKGRYPVLDDFVFPDLGPLTLGPKILYGFMRRNIIQKPVVDNEACKLCGECWKICPAKAITRNIKRIRYNYKACIRCYCCLEICPHGAIRIQEPLLGKLIRPYL